MYRTTLLRACACVGLAISIILLVFSPVEAAVNKRRALVIANAEYAYTRALRNPANDANLIANRLKDLGFEVRLEKNLDARGFSEVVQNFSSGLDRDTDALFYYAGHGLQFRGENYLVGVDAKLKSEATLQFETFRLNSVLHLLEGRTGTVLLFWDACRTNPLADDLMRSVSEPASEVPAALVRGAAPVPPSRGDTLVVFSAEPGKNALDGRGEFSPFAEALGRHIATPDLEVEAMLKRVTADVLQATRSMQRPQRLSQLTQEFYFRREGRARLAEEEEIKQLKNKLAQLERERGPQKRFKIIGTERDATRTANPPPRDELVRGANSSAGADTTTSDRGQRNVVIAVNTPASVVIRKLRVSPDGKLIALGGEDGIVRVVDLATFEVIKAIRAHRGRVSDLDFSADSKTLLTAGRDGAIRFWEASTGKPAKPELKRAGSIPYSARLNPNLGGRFVLMGDRTGRLVAWDLARNRRVITNGKFHAGPVLSVAYQPGGGGTFLSAGGDGVLKIRLPEGERLSIHAHKGPIFQSGYDPSGARIYTAGNDRRVKIWNPRKLEQERPEAVFEGHLKYVLAADMSADGRMIVSGGGDKALNLWNVGSRELAGRMEGHTSDVESVAFTPNSRFIISTSEDKSMRIWSVDNREELVRMFFKKDGDKYAGVTFDDQSFGDRDAGLISVYVDGKVATAEEADRIVKYIGRKIAILDNGN